MASQTAYPKKVCIRKCKHVTQNKILLYIYRKVCILYIYLYVQWMKAFAIHVVGFIFIWGNNSNKGAINTPQNIRKSCMKRSCWMLKLTYPQSWKQILKRQKWKKKEGCKTNRFLSVCKWCLLLVQKRIAPPPPGFWWLVSKCLNSWIGN